MTIKRKSETPAMARRICFAQGVIPCCLCGKRLMPEDEVIREHKHALCFGGPDEEDNMGYAHKACSALKTYGPGHIAKGDITENARSKRLANPEKKDNRKRRRIRGSSEIQNGGKLQGRKTIAKRKFDKRRTTREEA